jgi:hypothetical protein
MESCNRGLATLAEGAGAKVKNRSIVWTGHRLAWQRCRSQNEPEEGLRNKTKQSARYRVP